MSEWIAEDIGMQALLFEVLPRPGHEGHYLDRAAQLRPVLEAQDGLLFLDRYRSQSRAGLILSHSLWEDEAALVAWRRNSQHEQAQIAGRGEHFADYRIRISVVCHHAAPQLRIDKPHPKTQFTEASKNGGSGLIIVSSHGVLQISNGETFESITTENTYLTIVDVATESQRKQMLAKVLAMTNVTDIKVCLVSRDYGMFERAEAPPDFRDRPAAQR